MSDWLLNPKAAAAAALLASGEGGESSHHHHRTRGKTSREGSPRDHKLFTSTGNGGIHSHLVTNGGGSGSGGGGAGGSGILPGSNGRVSEMGTAILF